MAGIKEQIKSTFVPDFKYDNRVLFKYKDGGQMYLDLKGNCFKEDLEEYKANE